MILSFCMALALAPQPLSQDQDSLERMRLIMRLEQQDIGLRIYRVVRQLHYSGYDVSPHALKYVEEEKATDICSVMLGKDPDSDPITPREVWYYLTYTGRYHEILWISGLVIKESKPLEKCL
jgi:hypothetical protein